MNYKPLTFVLNERCVDLDVFYTLMFFRKPDKSGSYDKKLRIIEQYPQLESFDNVPTLSQEHFIKEEISNIYAHHKADLLNALNESRRLWINVEDRFETAVTDVFASFPWPEGDYKCYLSVIDVNAIIKAEKSFQLFYGMVSRDITNTVIAHELLHFMFYSYMERYPEMDKINLWKMTETFNKFIQNTDRFKDFKYLEDKLLDIDQEKILSELTRELNPESATVEDYLHSYRSKYL